MSWTDSQIESLITFYSSMLVSDARNFAAGVKNRRQKPAPVSGACVMGIRKLLGSVITYSKTVTQLQQGMSSLQATCESHHRNWPRIDVLSCVSCNFVCDLHIIILQEIDNTQSE